MAGLEPADEGVKVPCLTTWLHPNIIVGGMGKTAIGRTLPFPFPHYIKKKEENNAGISPWWAFRDSNPGPTGYEPAALTN